MTPRPTIDPSQPFETRLAQSWPPSDWSYVTVLVAVSGGPDSLALLRALNSLRLPGSGQLVAAHFNHHSRGEESQADERFVIETCETWGIRCEVDQARPGHFERSPDGFESAARDARYEFLEGTAARVGARYLATGHTADDQAETVLHRILRGTGIAGLSGIPRVRPLNSLTSVVRPLLSFRRAEVMDYLAGLGQPFREDATNRDPRYTRNRLRHELLPLLERDYNPQVVDSLLRLGSLAREVQAVVDEQVEQLAATAVQTAPDGATIDCRNLAQVGSHLVRELLIHVWRSRGWPEQDMSHEKWCELARLVGSPTEATQVFPGGIRAQAHLGGLELSRPHGDERQQMQ